MEGLETVLLPGKQVRRRFVLRVPVAVDPCGVFFIRHPIEKRLLGRRGGDRRKPVASINSFSRFRTRLYKTVETTTDTAEPRTQSRLPH
jgi:hypothetical protein